MVSQNDFVNHYNNLYESGAIYLWGANCETITKELTDRLYNSYASATYNKAYYNSKLASGQGKIGADCSGSICPLSKADNTAAGYFAKCTKTGLIGSMPRNVVSLVFNKNKTHVGAYLGNGFTIEMRSSQLNVWKEQIKTTRWYYYGLPNFVDYNTPLGNVSTAVDLTKNTNSSNMILKKYQTWLNDEFGQRLTVDGEWGPKTKKATVAAIQTILVTEYHRIVTIDGAFGTKTKASFPSWAELNTNANAFSKLTYIIHIFLYICGYEMAGIINNTTVSTIYSDSTYVYVRNYQGTVRGLVSDGKFGQATFYQAFR